MSHTVFISHSRSDYDYAEAIKENLELHGVRAYLSGTILKAEDDLSEDIRERIVGSDLIFLLISKESVESANVVKEIEFVKEAGKEDIIVPFKLEEVSGTELINEKEYYVPLYTEYEENLNELTNWFAQKTNSQTDIDLLKSIIFIAVAAIGFVPLRKD